MLKNKNAEYKEENRLKLNWLSTIFVVILIVLTIVTILAPFWLSFFAKSKVIEVELLRSLFISWISVYGSILGGALTLFGVVITIKHQKKSEIVSQRNIFKPFLKVKVNPKIASHLGKDAIDLEITNVGRGELYLSELYIYVKYSWDNEKNLMDYFQYDRGEELIAPNESFSKYCDFLDSIEDRKNIRLNIYVNFFYYDLFQDRVIEQKEVCLRLRALISQGIVIDDNEYYEGF